MARNEAERREYQRKWAAERRAEIRAERDANRRGARADAEANAPRPLLTALDGSLSAAWWLCDSDAAAVNLARLLADAFDVAHYMGDQRATSRICGPLQVLLDRLGLMPTSRMRLNLKAGVAIEMASRLGTAAGVPRRPN